MTELEKLKLLLGEKDASKDDVLSFTLENVHDLIRNYCNIPEVPSALENTAVRMAADLFRSEGYGNAAAPQTAKSVSRGDVTISYSDGATVASVTGGKAILDDYRTQLQAFRRLRR